MGATRLNTLLKQAQTAYFRKLPKSVFRAVHPFVGPIIRYMRAKAFEKEFERSIVTKITGTAVNSKEPLRATVIGGELEANFYSNLLFEKIESKQQEHNSIASGEINSVVQKEKMKANIIISRASESQAEEYWKKGFIVLPDQIQQELDIKSGTERIEKKFKSILRAFAVNKEVDDLKFETSYNPNDLDFFYEKMYVPLVKSRFKDTGFIYPIKELKEYFASGAIIFVLKGGKRIGGILLTKRNAKLNTVVLGVLGGDEGIIRSGYLPVMYHQAVRFAKENKFDLVNFGGSKPFVMDGVLRFKKKIGAKVLINESTPIINALYFPPIQSTAGKSFFDNNQFIIIRKSALAVVSAFTSPDPEPSEVLRAVRKSLIPGIRKVILISPHFPSGPKEAFKKDKKVVFIEEPDFFNFQKRIMAEMN